MKDLWDDLRYGWRVLRRNPGFAGVAILTLGLGIGANAAIFSIVNAVLIRPLPFPDSNRIVLVWETDANRHVERGIASPAEFLDWREQNHVFQELAAWRTWFYNLTGGAEAEQVWGVHATGNFFRLLQVKPILGRDFLPEEETPGHEQVVIISYAVWQRQYGGDAGIIGKTISVDDQLYTVVGVLPRGFNLFGTSRQYDLWMPFAWDRAQLDRTTHSVIVFARLRSDVNIRQAQAEMATILERLKKQYPGVDQQNGVRLVQLQDDLSRGVGPALLILLAAVGLVLLIACANVANLMLARAASREREIAVRASLGAGRRRIIRQLLTESAFLALIGGALGIGVAYGGLHLLRTAMPAQGGYGEIPHSELIGINGPVLAFTLVVSLLTGIVFGLAPAIQISRSELHESLKEGSRGSTGGRRSHLVRSALVVSEVALSLVLLVGAGLLIRSFVRLMSEDLGFNPSNVLAMQLWLPASHYKEGQPVANFYQQVLERVAALPGVQAGAVNFLPLSGWADYCDFDIAGRVTPPSGEQFTTQYRVADWRYLNAMGLPLKKGRWLEPADGPDAAGVTVINESLVRRYWPNEDPVGKQIRLHFSATHSLWEPQARDQWLTIVGVVGDIRDLEWGEQKTPQVYLPYTQNPSRMMRLIVRAGSGNAAELTPAVRHAIESVDANQPVTEVRTMNEFLASAVSQQRLSMLILALFAGVATSLAAVGIYGVMAYAVSQRAHEIGIRMALGAEPARVLRMVVGDGMRLAGIGLALGILGGLGAVRYLESQLYGVKATDPLTFAGVAAVLAIVTLAACYFPARRATRVDPLVALRYE